MKKILFSIITALGIVCFQPITFKYVCDFSEHGPDFYGFPFVQETNTTWIFSMSGDIYFLGFLGNLLVWSFVIRLVLIPLLKLEKKVNKLITIIVSYTILCFALFVSYVNFAAIDWRLKFSHDNFKMNYYHEEIECERKLIFFNF